MSNPKCPYCGNRSEMVTGAVIILRCWRCYVQPGKPHSKYIPIKDQQP